MSDKIFDQMLSRYEIITENDYRNALHEIMQEIALAGLYRGGFFDKAAFYGGTALRIFYKIDRFSEDLDFSLLKREHGFNIEKYFKHIENEFNALGRDILIVKKEKTTITKIESAFLKDNSQIYDIKLGLQPNIKIKIEVDTDPPGKFNTEQKFILLPFSFMTRCFTLPDLFAGKMHAFLFRSWKNRVKGRDWYDFEWYIRNNTDLNFEHFCERAKQFSNNPSIPLDKASFKNLLKEKIRDTDINLVKQDLLPFIKSPKDLQIWSTDYFLQLVDLIKFL
ncbi:MAG: nucleotidyl transferase AbiEii/AbiGii toxin family protein [Endomicrobia bacterium]|nr:nucleotidyl transferase AbiEii/AbiGii toxin family protein [Endomicrobiia bacterium]